MAKSAPNGDVQSTRPSPAWQMEVADSVGRPSLFVLDWLWGYLLIVIHGRGHTFVFNVFEPGES
jgi:hypothetical protein